MKQYKGVIFDLDGTLLNTLMDLSDSVNTAMTSLGYPSHDYDTYKLKIGKGFRNLMEVSLPPEHRDDETIDKALEIFLKTYNETYQNKTVPYEGILTLVEVLHREGIAIGVNSNKRTDYTKSLIEKFFSHFPFVAVYGEREGIPKKPDPTSALEIAGLMQLKPDEILYIGDSKTDMTTGKNAGMDTIGVTWGFRGREELETYGGTYVVDSPREILDIIL